MRIISGKRRGAQLVVPEGGIVRPTADRVRQGLYNLLQGGRYGKPFEVAVIADVFAGSGALGLEAWSRGADDIVFIENNPTAIKSLTANIEKLDAGDDVTVIRRDATRNMAWPTAAAGLVFIDPPWQYHDDDPDLALLALTNLINMGAVATDALISIEHDTRRPAQLPHGVEHLETRNWGKSACTICAYRG